MEIQQLDILLKLLIAHLLADFIFQTNSIVKGKKKGLKSRFFYVHIAIVGLLTYVMLADWTNWWAPIFIMALHALIDLLKIRINQDGTWIYLADQMLHIISIILLWILLADNSIGNLFEVILETTLNNNVLIIVFAYLLVSIPIGILIGYMTLTWQTELNANKQESLTDAGKWIGITERILVLTFILVNQWAPIGFLLAAKSVFRFGDLKEGKEHKKTEYILIGTFLSFTFSIILGIFILFVLKKMNQ